MDPGRFYPLRFSPEIKRNPCAFLGFGVGPRHCIGMKFAIIELKMALVKLLTNYEIKPGAGLPDRLEYHEGIVRTPKDGINVVFVGRESTQ